MSRITLDSEIIQKLIANVQSVEVCDSSGKVFGRFTPHPDPYDYNLEPDITEAQLRERLKETGGRTLAEIMADLEKRP